MGGRGGSLGPRRRAWRGRVRTQQRALNARADVNRSERAWWPSCHAKRGMTLEPSHPCLGLQHAASAVSHSTLCHTLRPMRCACRPQPPPEHGQAGTARAPCHPAPCHPATGVAAMEGGLSRPLLPTHPAGVAVSSATLNTGSVKFGWPIYKVWIKCACMEQQGCSTVWAAKHTHFSYACVVWCRRWLQGVASSVINPARLSSVRSPHLAHRAAFAY